MKQVRCVDPSCYIVYLTLDKVYNVSGKIHNHIRVINDKNIGCYFSMEHFEDYNKLKCNETSKM
jgi:hypothetical protein